ncbi:MAG: type IV secretion system protein [Alphaproteobacteria bacterium]|nr:type IV secretion system protein [Alphaproteobacteria bacterium]
MADDKNSGYENVIGWSILIVVFGALLYLLWYFQSQNIRNAVRWMRYAEMTASKLVLGDDFEILQNGQLVATIGQIQDFTGKLDKRQLNSQNMDLISLGALYPLRYFFTFIIILMSFWALFRGPRALFRQKLDLNHLINRQSGNFPAIAPFVKFNPTNQPPRPPGAPVPAELPAFAEALSPEEWIAYYDIPVPNGKVDADAAARAFTRQLGPPWRGTMHMAPYKQILLAAFCLKSVRKRADADEMLGKLSRSWTFEGGLKIDSSLISKARKILRDRDISGKTLAKCNQHAYENTVMLRALATAREEGGVLAPAQFLWLRAFDRLLWYPLNNLGRQSHHMEALGAICHYKAEKTAQRPIPRPKMEDAVKSISEYIASPNARPIPALDYSKSKKRGIKKVKT